MGWVLGGKRGLPALADSGRSPMAWGSRPCFRGDLNLCMGVLPSWYFDLCTTQGRNLYCGATRPRAVNAVCRCSLPCVGMADRRTPRASPAREALLLLLETLAAKEAKKRFDCGGKHLGCRHWAGWGLQCGLSGSRAARWATPRRDAERETARSATRGEPRGNPART